MKLEQQQKMYDALRTIARDYQTTSQLRRDSEKQYGLDFEESLEMAYENMQETAKCAIKGLKRPI